MKKGKKLTAILLSIMLVVGACVLWATLTASASLSWENPTQDEGAVNFLTVNCDGAKKYLKIVKTGSVSGESGNLTVYEADTLAEALQADNSSSNITGMWTDIGAGTETWQIELSGTSAYGELSELTDLSSCSVEFDYEQEAGATKYFRLKCADNSGVKTRYLKVTKTGIISGESGNLTVYEADSVKEVLSSSFLSVALNGSWAFNNGNEIWTISADGGNYLAAEDLRELPPTEWGGEVICNFTGEIENGTVKYFRAEILGRDREETKFLTVTKSGPDNLTIYEADSLTGAVEREWASTNLTGTYANYDGAETWAISLSGPDYLAITHFEEVRTVLEVSDLPTDTGLPEGAACYCKVSCQKTDSTMVYKYLKVVKDSNGSLKVYEGDTLGSIYTEPTVSFQAVYTVSGDSAPYTETWLLTFASDNDYSRIITFSPLSTTVSAVKVWDGQSGGEYIDVANDTSVRFKLNINGADAKTFYVKKNENRLKLSADNNTYEDYMIYGDKTVNAYLAPANDGVSAEQWVITITGYQRDDSSGTAIEYEVAEEDISSSQHWRAGGTLQKHTYAGREITASCVINYTLMLRTGSGEEIGVLRISKVIADNKVTELKVQGLSCHLDKSSYDLYTCATVSDARCADKVVTPSEHNEITFNLFSGISLDDIIGKGVTVNFHTGVDNGIASVFISLTSSGKLSYEFKHLPADLYMLDPHSELSDIDVDSYKVVTEIITSY